MIKLSAGQRRVLKWLIPISLAVWFPIRFSIEIACYHTHYEEQIIGYIAGFLGLACCVAGLVRSLLRRERSVAALYIVAAISCVFFCYWITRIPFCPMCEPMKKSELGFMLEPFADRFSDFYLE